MKEYRIKELFGKFHIEIKVVKIKGYLWWKKEVVDWCDTDSFGNKYSYYLNRYIPLKYSDTFNSMREALEQIKKWNAEPIYHNVENGTSL